MKMFYVFLIIFVSACSTLNNHSNRKPSMVDDHGRKVGNGGTGCVCRDDNGEVASAEIADVCEGKLLSPSALSYDDKYNGSEEKLIKKILVKLSFNQSYYSQVKDELGGIESKFIFSESGKKIDKVDDTEQLPDCKILYHNNKCENEQIANYWDDKIKITKMFYDKLNTFNKVAFKIHEAIYAVERKIKNKFINSDNTRTLVSYLVAEGNQSNKIKVLSEIVFENSEKHIDDSELETIKFESYPIQGISCKSLKHYFTFMFAPNGNLFECNQNIMIFKNNHFGGSMKLSGLLNEVDNVLCPKMANAIKFKPINSKNYIDVKCTDDNKYLELDVHISLFD